MPRDSSLQEEPLPDLEEFLQEVRKHLRSDRLLLSQYTYTEKNTVRRFDKKGNLKTTHERIYEIYPSDEPELTYRRLIAEDGNPIDSRKLEKQDRKHDRKQQKHRKKLEREGTDQRERREDREEKARQKEEAAIDEMYRLYQIEMEGREYLERHPTIVLSFQPRPGFKPKTREGKILAKVAGRAWFSEEDCELVRAEFSVMKDISFGWGLLVKLNRGASGSLKRRKINDEIWLPAEWRFKGSARLLLFKGMHVELQSQYSDFRKFSVESQVKFGNQN